jgi:alpha-mannosidase
MTWNDTNRFPYDSFYWQGLDGSRVLTHLNRSHLWPTPKNLTEYLVHGRQSGDPVKEKTVSRRRLFSFGYGDGGGGPQFEMLEMARRIADVDGLPRSGYTRVGDFMKALETEIRDPSIYAGELYLELHRGTLTNQHRIKRNNRLGEIALHDLEYAAVRRALGEGKNPSGAEIDPLTETLLINQFHDILPGTCIPPVHEQSLRETSTLIEKARRMSAELLSGPDAEGTVTVTNTLSFPRQDPFYLEDGDYDLPDGAVQQRVDTLEGRRTAVSGLRLEAFSGKTLSRKKAPSQAGADTAGPFRHEGGVLETPFARITFAANGTIESLIDKSAGNRELRGEGYPLGTFLIAEDLPQSWDNWDLDADIEDKFQDCSGLLERKVIAQGPVEFRIRSLYRLSPKSTLEQDLVFYAASPLIRYETMIDWQDNHRFLKAAFDTSIHAAEARHEIQFGHIRRSVFRGTDIEKAKFEVSNHKYTDISETRYGAALLNDCKYGISVQGGRMRLSLHKGGNRPDFKGDLGRHYCAYGFLPHRGGFSVETVVRPAYTFNYRPLITPGRGEMPSLLRVDAPTVIVETVKPCEEAGRAFILRLYECEGAWTPAALTVPGAREIRETNILEEDTGRKAAGPEIRLEFRPFEIKTLRVEL